MPRFSTTSQGYLQITNSMKADSGRFTCIANNGGGDAQTSAYVGIVGVYPHYSTFSKLSSYVKVQKYCFPSGFSAKHSAIG